MGLAFAPGTAAMTVADLKSWAIVCDAAATETEQYAAGEFQLLFQEMTGTELPIVTLPAPGQNTIFIGPGAAKKAGETDDIAALGEEGFCLRVANDAICIYGGRPRGTLYGVYEFFEELCGVRLLTFDHTYVPDNAEAQTLRPGTYDYTPPFAFRWSYYGETNRDPRFAARLRTNTVPGDKKLGGITGYRLVSHNVAYLLPIDKHGAKHPEYYALVDGRRTLEMHGGGPQLCMTNPEVLDHVVAAVRAEIAAKPDVKNINVAHMDNEAYCTCDTCAAIDAREESHAGATLAFVNAVAERIEPDHPDILISTYAYQYTRKPPKTLKPRRNVMVQLCSIECCVVHAIDDPNCPLNRAFCEDMAGWNAITDNIFIWHYNTNFRSYLLPFPNLRSIGKSVAYFAENSGRGVFMQAAGNGFSTELSDLRNYVMSRCLWKPGRDSWEEALEFCRMHYGDAAPAIINYLTYYHDMVDHSGLHPACFPTESAVSVSPESARRIMGYFEQARAAVPNGVERRRVAKASLCAYRAALSAASMRLKYEGGICTPDLDGLDSNLLARYTTLSEEFGVVMDTEHTRHEDYLATTRTLHAGTKAVKIENDTWRVVLLPELNARIVEMTHKPSDRNIVQPTRSLDRFRYEDWARQGAGPTADHILPYTAETHPDRVQLTLTADDGAKVKRLVSLVDDAVRFEVTLTANTPRAFDFMVHPEYDTATMSTDPDVMGIYVRDGGWIHANKDWQDALPTEAQRKAIEHAAPGGRYAYFNHAKKFGVEQRFDPNQFENLSLFWSPERIQINLEMIPRVTQLAAGEQGRYAYEVRYLDTPP
jgi:hypothetical protein